MKRSPSSSATASASALLTAPTNLTLTTPNLHRTFKEIPYGIRDRVVSLVRQSEEEAEEAKRTQLRLNQELLQLKRRYQEADREFLLQQKKRDLLLNQMKLSREKLGALEDDAEGRRLRTVKNSEAISRLSRTNKSLVDAFSKLYEDGNASSSANSNQRAHLHLNIANEEPALDLDPPQEPVTATSNEKLRERLLQIAREHNRVVKNVEVLELKVEGLRSSVRFAEKRNRQLQHELEELRESASLDGSGCADLLPEEKQASGGKEDNMPKKKKAIRAPTSSRLRSLLDSSGFNAMDGIRHFDALMHHIVSAPTNVSEKELAAHLCNRFICHMFKAETICLFIVQPGGHLMHRYASDSSEVKAFYLTPQFSMKSTVVYAPSIAECVLRHKQPLLLTRPEEHDKFNFEVDCTCSANGTSSLLAVPVCDMSVGEVVGALHLVNREGREGGVFSPLEEQYAAAYGELLGTVLSSSSKALALRRQSERLCSLLQAPPLLLDLLQSRGGGSAGSGDSNDSSGGGVELGGLLSALEETLRRTLRCSYVKAFLCQGGHQSEGQGSEEEGRFLCSLEGPPLSLKGGPQKPHDVKRTPLCSSHPLFCASVAVFSVLTRRPFLSGLSVPLDHHDFCELRPAGAEYNPEVDMCPPPPVSKKSSASSLDSGSSCSRQKQPLFYCLPLLDLQQRVVGCLQASPSPLSPPFRPEEGTHRRVHPLSFEGAMGWAGLLLAPKICHLLGSLGGGMAGNDCFLEPLSLTESLTAMEVSLAAFEEPFVPNKVITAIELDNQISEWDNGQPSLEVEKKPKEPESPVDNKDLVHPQKVPHSSVEKTREGETDNKGEVNEVIGGEASHQNDSNSDNHTIINNNNTKSVKEYMSEVRALKAELEHLKLAGRQPKDTKALSRLEKEMREKLEVEYRKKLEAARVSHFSNLEEAKMKSEAVVKSKLEEKEKLEAQLRQFETDALDRQKAWNECVERCEKSIREAKENISLN